MTTDFDVSATSSVLSSFSGNKDSDDGTENHAPLDPMMTIEQKSNHDTTTSGLQTTVGERTSLLGHGNNSVPSSSNDNTNEINTKRPNAYQFYFSSHNPTVQTYYRFTATSLTPFAALHTRPLDGPMSNGSINGGGAADYSGKMMSNMNGKGSSNVTGLLRRSAVLPSHGTSFLFCHNNY